MNWSCDQHKCIPDTMVSVLWKTGSGQSCQRLPKKKIQEEEWSEMGSPVNLSLLLLLNNLNGTTYVSWQQTTFKLIGICSISQQVAIMDTSAPVPTSAVLCTLPLNSTCNCKCEFTIENHIDSKAHCLSQTIIK